MVLEYEFNMNLFLLNNLYYNYSLIFIFNVIDVGVDIDNNTNIIINIKLVYSLWILGH